MPAIPPPPPGFTMDVPPPPEGFKLDSEASVPPPPPGFTMDEPNFADVVGGSSVQEPPGLGQQLKQSFVDAGRNIKKVAWDIPTEVLDRPLRPIRESLQRGGITGDMLPDIAKQNLGRAAGGFAAGVERDVAPGLASGENVAMMGAMAANPVLGAALLSKFGAEGARQAIASTQAPPNETPEEKGRRYAQGLGGAAMAVAPLAHVGSRFAKDAVAKATEPAARLDLDAVSRESMGEGPGQRVLNTKIEAPAEIRPVPPREAPEPTFTGIAEGDKFDVSPERPLRVPPDVVGRLQSPEAISRFVAERAAHGKPTFMRVSSPDVDMATPDYRSRIQKDIPEGTHEAGMSAWPLWHPDEGFAATDTSVTGIAAKASDYVHMVADGRGKRMWLLDNNDAPTLDLGYDGEPLLKRPRKLADVPNGVAADLYEVYAKGTGNQNIIDDAAATARRMREIQDAAAAHPEKSTDVEIQEVQRRLAELDAAAEGQPAEAAPGETGAGGGAVGSLGEATGATGERAADSAARSRGPAEDGAPEAGEGAAGAESVNAPAPGAEGLPLEQPDLTLRSIRDFQRAAGVPEYEGSRFSRSNQGIRDAVVGNEAALVERGRRARIGEALSDEVQYALKQHTDNLVRNGGDQAEIQRNYKILEESNSAKGRQLQALKTAIDNVDHTDPAAVVSLAQKATNGKLSIQAQMDLADMSRKAGKMKEASAETINKRAEAALARLEGMGEQIKRLTIKDVIGCP